MSNLFSIFDPSTAYFLPWNWVISYLCLILLPFSFWIIKTQLINFIQKLLFFIYGEFIAILNKQFICGGTLIPVTFFLIIILRNVMGLIPYVFTRTSHLIFTVRLALPLWLGHVLLAWKKNFSAIIAHLVPLGTPAGLIPFIVLIELISNIIRPLTLSVRLAANMVAGHLLLTLLSSITTISGYGAPFIIIALIRLITLEIAVAIIQAYVFRVLNVLYLNEIESSKI